jgi:hypothetical protein
MTPSTKDCHNKPMGMFMCFGPFSLKGKDNLQIDFMALTMINPASSWFEIAELPVVEQLR